VSDATRVTPALLAEHPLPDHGSASSKRERGTALVIGGTQETPGAVLLAGLAALRAGAGTLQLATDEAVAAALAVAVPEARVVGIRPDAAETVASLAADADAVAVGTGTLDPASTEQLLPAIVEAARRGGATLVVDAAALDAIDASTIEPVAPRTVLMPNPAELARMLDVDLEDVTAAPETMLHDAVDRFGCIVTLRDSDSWISGRDLPTFVDSSGNPGLAVSGSGDVLAGLITGYAARGAAALDALLWATHVHGVAGEHCAREVGRLGYLAREVVDAVPRAHRELGG
jgi:hydroxyethylthiazole kinase-like uncharacterized protein yjeF